MSFARWTAALAAAGLLLVTGCQEDKPTVDEPTGAPGQPAEEKTVENAEEKAVAETGEKDVTAPPVADVTPQADVAVTRDTAPAPADVAAAGNAPVDAGKVGIAPAATTDVVQPKDVVAPGDAKPGPTDAVAVSDVSAGAPEKKDVPSPTAADVAAAADGVAAGAPTGPAIDRERSRKVFDEATKLIKAGELEKATELLEEWLKLTPMDLTNRRNLIHIYMKLKKLEEAELHLKFMATELASEVEWWLHLGRVQAQLGKYSQAVESLEKALEISPRDLGIALDLARTHSKRKDWDAARKVLDKAMVAGKRTADLLRELAPVLVELGEYNSAFDAYRKLQRLEPSYDIALIMAKIAARHEKCPDVVDALVGWDKDFADETPFLLLGSCAMKKGERSVAEKYLLKGLEANKECFDCALWLGDILFDRKDWPRAIAYYGMAAPLRPQDYRPFNQLGKALANSDKHIEATRAFAKANERKPKDPEIVYMWGVEAVRSGQKGDAWKIWGQLEELDKARAAELRKMLTK